MIDYSLMSEFLGAGPEYLNDYTRFIDALPTGERDILLSLEDRNAAEQALSRYGAAGYRSDIEGHQSIYATEFEVQPFPPGFIRPYQIDTVSSLIRWGDKQWRGQDYVSVHYGDVEAARRDPSRYASRKWEEAYAKYVRQRHQFHLAFLRASVGLADAAEVQETFDAFAGEPLIPAPQSYEYNSAQRQPTENHEVLYNRAEWTAYSLANVLFAPPERFDAQTHQQALRLFASLVSPQEAAALAERGRLYLGKGDDAEAIREQLPPSFVRSHDDLEGQNNDWRTNADMVSYFGGPPFSEYKAFEPACAGILLERPDDLMQVLFLHLGDDRAREALPVLHGLGRMPQPILDRVVHDQASYRLLRHGSAAVPADPLALNTHPFSGEDVLLQPRGDAETLQVLVSAAVARIAALGADVRMLEDAVGRQDTTLAEQAAIIGELNARAYVSPLFARHGLNIDAPAETLALLVDHLRVVYAERYHPQTGSEPDRQLYRQLMTELNDVLRARGLKVNRRRL
jgi:hypothetical protein